LRRDRRFPAAVLGPVLLSALRRLASICLSELTGRDPRDWLRFVIWTFFSANLGIAFGANSIVANTGKGCGTFGFLLAFRKGMRLEPKRPGRDDGINSSALPPSRFVAAAVDPAMMSAAQRDSELIADLAA
jgi:hypothetical protein